MDALDLIFDNYEEFLDLGEYVKSCESEWSKKQNILCETFTQEQKKMFDDWNGARIRAFKGWQKNAFKCGVRAGANLIFDLMDKDATNVENIKRKTTSFYGLS